MAKRKAKAAIEAPDLTPAQIEFGEQWLEALEAGTSEPELAKELGLKLKTLQARVRRMNEKLEAAKLPTLPPLPDAAKDERAHAFAQKLVTAVRS